MKIDFTEQEYQKLVEMLLVAEWVIRSHEEEPQDETEAYGALRKKVLAFYREMGMEGDFDYDPEEDEYYETAEYEERAPHMRFISEYEEQMLWSLLADKLAARDVAAEAQGRAGAPLSTEARLVRLFEITERYEQEFAEHGLARVQVVTDPRTPMD